MDIQTVIQIGAGITMMVVQLVLVAFFLARLHSQNAQNKERIMDLKAVVDTHIRDLRVHQDLSVQKIQFEHLEKKIVELEKRVEALSTSMDEIKTILMEART